MVSMSGLGDVGGEEGIGHGRIKVAAIKVK